MKVLCFLLVLALSSKKALSAEEDQDGQFFRNALDTLAQVKDLPVDTKQLSLNVNKYIDELIDGYAHKIPSEIKIDDIHSKFAHDCYVEISPGVKRFGDAVFNVEGQTVTFDFGLSTGRIGLRCKWEYKLFFWKLSGTIKAHTDRVSLSAEFSLNLASSPPAPKVEDFKVEEFLPVKTDVTGLSIANALAENYLNGRVNNARDKIISTLEELGRKKLQEALEGIKLPSELANFGKK